MNHDPHTDVSEVRRPTRDQRKVLELLGLNAADSPWVRLSPSDWARVDGVVVALIGARQRTAVGLEQVGIDATLTA